MMACSTDALALCQTAVQHVRAEAALGGLPLFALNLGVQRAEFVYLSAVLEEGFMGPTPLPSTQALPPPEFPHTALLALLWSFRTEATPACWAAAAAVACGCFGHRHLWQDLGLSGRPEVTALLQAYFPGLVALNSRHLKWKRFLFMRLGEWLGQPGLQPPHCGGCDQYATCYPAVGHVEASAQRA